MTEIFKTPVSKRIMFAALLLVVALAYLPGLSGGFISDDHRLIQERTAIYQSASGLRDVVTHPFWWGTENVSGRDLYRPWASFTYWLDHHIAGPSPLVYHLSNYMVHLANAFLLLILLTGFMQIEAAFLVTAVTSLCPVALTSVGWVAGRTDLWATFFTLLFLIAFRTARKSSSAWPTVAAAACFFAALASKEIAVIAPLIAWLIEYATALKAETKASKSITPQNQRSGWSRYGILLLPFVVYLALRNSALESGVPRGVGLTSLFTSLPYLAERVVRTALHIIAPVHYTFFSEFLWSRPEQRRLGFALIWLVFIALLVLISLGLRRRKLWAVGGLWFGVTILPVYAFGQAFAPIADFYAYMGLAGFWIFVVDGLRDFAAGRHIPTHDYQRVELYSGLGITALFAILTFVRLPILNSDYSLMSYTVETEPKSGKALLKLAEIYEASNQREQVEQLLRRAVELDTTATDPRLRLAGFYLSHGDVTNAAPHIDALAQYAPQDASAQAMIAHFYYVASHCPEAVDTYRRSFSLGVPSPEVLFDYGLALLCVNNNDEASSVYEEAIRRKPQWPEAYNNLGICRENLGDLDGAIGAYNQAVTMQPSLLAGWESLSVVYLRQGKIGEAQRAAARYFALNPPTERAERLRTQLNQAGGLSKTP